MTTKSEVGLLDTNILVYASDGDHDWHATARRLRDDVFRGVVPGCLAPQILAEFYATVTNPRRVPVPLGPEAARRAMSLYASSTVPMIYPSREMVDVFLSLLARRRITRQGVHDVALAATMLANGVRRIYTANVKDFAMFEEIEVINPFAD